MFSSAPAFLPPLALWEADCYGLTSWSALCPLILADLALALLRGMFLPLRVLQTTCVSRLKVTMFLQLKNVVPSSSTFPSSHLDFLVAQWQRICLPMQETEVPSLGQEDPLRRKWQPTPVFLPGKYHGRRSLVGHSPWGCKSLTELSTLASHLCRPRVVTTLQLLAHDSRTASCNSLTLVTKSFLNYLHLYNLLPTRPKLVYSCVNFWNETITSTNNCFHRIDS